MRPPIPPKVVLLLLVLLRPCPPVTRPARPLLQAKPLRALTSLPVTPLSVSNI